MIVVLESKLASLAIHVYVIVPCERSLYATYPNLSMSKVLLSGNKDEAGSGET